MFFSLSTFVLALLLALFVIGTTVAGAFLGRRLRLRPGSPREQVGVVQSTLLGFVGLLLAFGLTMAVGRYDNRRSVVVEEANAIGTAYLRAQLLPEPSRTTSLDLLRQYADAAISLAGHVPDAGGFDADLQRIDGLTDRLWATAGDAVRADPVGTAPRLYVEALNEVIDSHTDRVSSLRNRVPSAVMLLQLVGSAVALGVLALYLSLLSRGTNTAIAASVVVILILFISFDLDRPQRGFITVPDAPLVDARTAMDRPPPALGP